jgi:hypothetical protein
MFANELKTINKLDNLTYDLSNMAHDMRCNVEDINTAVECLEDGIYGDLDNPDAVFNTMASDEATASRQLANFDKILTRIIAERIKLGNFEVSHTQGAYHV